MDLDFFGFRRIAVDRDVKMHLSSADNVPFRHSTINLRRLVQNPRLRKKLLYLPAGRPEVPLPQGKDLVN